MNRTSEAIHKYDGPEVLQYEDAPRPKPKPGELLIHVHAAGVNPTEWKVREGYLKDILPHRRCCTYMAACDLISNAYRCKKNKFILAAHDCGILHLKEKAESV
jgi:hypothetical protein